MQFHNLKRNKFNRASKQVGRGGKRGKTSGRGTKGQNARAGHKKRPEMRDIIKKIPKLRGRGRNYLKSRFAENVVLSLKNIEPHFSAGDTVNAKTLREKGVLRYKKGSRPKIKILGNDKIKKALNFQGINVSENAKKEIEAASGSINGSR